MNIPTTATALVRKLEPAHWDVHTRAGTGTCEYTGVGEPRGDGTCPRIALIQNVDSYLVRARHADGRAFVAVWVHRHGRLTKSGKPQWSLDMAWRGRRPDEYAPKQMTATELGVYVSEPVDADGEAA